MCMCSRDRRVPCLFIYFRLLFHHFLSFCFLKFVENTFFSTKVCPSKHAQNVAGIRMNQKRRRTIRFELINQFNLYQTRCIRASIKSKKIKIK